MATNLMQKIPIFVRMGGACAGLVPAYVLEITEKEDTIFDVKEQSKAAYLQHRDIWRKNARDNALREQKSFEELKHTGIGKAMVLVAMGYSFEQQVETLKKYQGNVDIMCCDKALGHLLDHGITPTYCLIADARVDYEKWMRPWADDPRISEVTAILNVCSNPEWAHMPNWKEIYFHVNRDAMEYEQEFLKMTNCPNVVIAGTNVSNAMLVFATQCSERGRQNFLGYDKYILVGYDYCFSHKGGYYAFDWDANGKRNYMKHLYLVDINGNQVYTSQNLAHSAQWINKYIQTFGIPAVVCADYTLLGKCKKAVLEDQMQYKLDPEDSGIVKKLDKEMRDLHSKIEYTKNKLRVLGEKHYYGFVASI